MVRTPGRPKSPTVHPRTRPEANDIALKHRQTNDWFRHDGKNVEQVPVPPAHLQGAQAKEIAEKNAGDSEEWFEHKSKKPGESQPPGATPPPPRCPTQESRQIHDKVYGKEEAWYKMEDNANYVSPRPKSRISDSRGAEISEKLGKANTNTWYKHEHGAEDVFTPEKPKSRTGPVSADAKNTEDKMHMHGTPDWYDHKKNGGEPCLAPKPKAKVHTQEAADYLERNKAGSASDWFQHSGKPANDVAESPRHHVNSVEAEGIATKMKGESGNWFSHDANKGYSEPKPQPRGTTPQAREMQAKAQGNEMQGILRQSNAKQDDAAKTRVKPEAKDIAEKNRQGLMDKYLNQAGNKGYNSDRPGGRTVKPEAQAIADKNKGVMSSSLGGYCDTPKRHDGPRIKGEAAENAARNKGSFSFNTTPEKTNSQASRAIKPEAEMNAARNKGTMSSIFGGDSGAPPPQRGSRVASGAAAANAERNKGTMGGIFNHN